MPRRFSRTQPTFMDWLAVQRPGSSYVGRIIRDHAHYPNATLGQLRRHPGRGRRYLSEVRRAPPHRVPWRFLSSRERGIRLRALEVLSEARQGEGSLSKLSRAHDISPRTVRRATGAFRKKGARWVPTRSDRIERWLKTYERGARTEVLVADSRTASLLSQYASAVKIYLETGDSRPLSEFEGRTYRDAYGQLHTFETRPEAIRGAVERSEADFEDFADLYAEPGGDEEMA